jgi:ankyrin repeat protein
MIDFLVKKGARPSIEALECLITLAPTECSHWLRTVIDKVVEEDDLSRVAHAILGNRFLGLSIDFLFPKGLDVNATNKNGKTLLYIAVQEGNAVLVEDLLRRGADRNLKATLPRKFPEQLSEKVERSPLDAAKLKVEELSSTGSASKKPVMEQIVRMLEDNS